MVAAPERRPLTHRQTSKTGAQAQWIVPYTSSKTMPHHVWFLCLSILPLILFRLPLTSPLSAYFQDDRYSHVAFIPLISACLVYSRRKAIFLEVQFCLSWGVPLLLLGMVFFWAIQRTVSYSDQNDYLSYATLSLVCIWVAAFVLSYGRKALRAAAFPLSYLLLMIPMPTILLDRAVGALQRGSADVTHALFQVMGVPADWLGLGFAIHGSHFEIAKECSGIHSTLILFVTSVLAGHLFLRSIAAKLCFSVFAVFVGIVKNAVRVVTIACLTVYVDGSFYDSWLHRKGGVVFGAFALAILVPSLLALRRTDLCFRREQPPSRTKEDATVERRALREPA